LKRTINTSRIGAALTNALRGSLAFAALMLLGFVSFAQYDTDDYSDYSSDYGYGDDTNLDSTTTYDDTGTDYGTDYGYGTGSSDKGNGNYVVKPKVKKIQHERFVAPYDSTLEMISYAGVVQVLDNENYEVEVDTIYKRAKNWMTMEFGEKELKKMTSHDAMNPNASEMEYKIKLKGSFPCEMEVNEFNQVSKGDVEFLMEIRIREGRYRYSVNNLVYIAETPVGAKTGDRTYFEYLMKAKDNVRGNDSILLAADKKINLWMKTLQEQCQKQPLEEEDEW
jgi:hypothetical protein